MRSPRDARGCGIEVVHQEVDTALVPTLSVAESIMMDVMAAGRAPFVHRGRLRAAARTILDRFAISIDPAAKVADCTLAQKQIVLIARGLSRSSRFLVLDEPTAPLSTVETAELFHVVRDLVDPGIGVLFISHRLDEIRELCSCVTVLRDGRVVADRDLAGQDASDITTLMLGRRLAIGYPSRAPNRGLCILSVRGLRDRERIRGIDLDVHAGEIVGIAGSVGAGKTELLRALFGASPSSCDKALFKGRPHRIHDPAASVRAGIAMVPEERRMQGILVGESVAVNLSLPSLGRFCVGPGFIRRRAERNAARTMIASLGIRARGEQQDAGQLSGGNQQKVAIGKWLLAEADLYLFDEPTKGVDVEAKQELFALIASLAAQGKAVLYATAELPEILGLTDRVCILRGGRIVGELPTSMTSEQELLAFCSGER